MQSWPRKVNSNMQQGNHQRRLARATLTLAVVCFIFGLAACKKHEDPNVKRFHLVGKVVAVDTKGSSVIVDHQAIPGFMDAMTMAYPVRDVRILAPLTVGDEITADVVVAADGAYLENIVVTKKGTGGKGQAPTSEHEPTPGEKVPDFALTNQDGKRIHLSSFQGHVLLVTFVYTRCPFPTFCPLVSRNFAEVYAQTRKNPALARKIRLLTISFTPRTTRRRSCAPTAAPSRMSPARFRLTAGNSRCRLRRPN